MERIVGDAANAESLWTRAEDFWQLVGWTFNCSLKHRKRWHRWRLWLQMMLDFLEADWEFCLKRSKDAKDNKEAILQESLLWHYVLGSASSVSRGARRRIVKAVLATASLESLKDFPEVWEDETAGPPRKKDEGDKQVGKVDFETGDMGEYDSDTAMQNVPDGVNEESSSTSAEDDGSVRSVHSAVQALGGGDAVDLRQRIIALVSDSCSTVAQALTIVSSLKLQPTFRLNLPR